MFQDWCTCNGDLRRMPCGKRVDHKDRLAVADQRTGQARVDRNSGRSATNLIYVLAEIPQLAHVCHATKTKTTVSKDLKIVGQGVPPKASS